MFNRKTKHNSIIIDENTSPLIPSEKTLLQCDYKRKLFAVSNLDNHPLESNKSKNNKPSREKVGKVNELLPSKAIIPIPLPFKSNDIPKDGLILDFDAILEILHEEPKKKKEDTLDNSSIKKVKNRKDKTFLKRKTAKSLKLKPSNDTKKNKYKLKTNDLYDINNFFSSTLKIVEKKEFITINCPSFKEYHYENNEEILRSIDKDNNIEIDEYEPDNELEDISEEYYKQFHDKFEGREKEYRMKIYEEYNKKQRKKETQDTDAESLTQINNDNDEDNKNKLNDKDKDSSLIIKITFDN